MTEVRHASLRTKVNQIASETERCLNRKDSASVSILFMLEPWWYRMNYDYEPLDCILLSDNTLYIYCIDTKFIQ